MDQSNPSGSQAKQKLASAMSPPSSTGGDAESQGRGSPTDRPLTPPVPILRPAQGAWDKAYVLGKASLPSSQQQQRKPSPAAHTRSKDKPSSSASPSVSRVAHPESAQRHSQASSGPAQTPPTYAPASVPVTSTSAPASSEHYRHSGYRQHPSPRQYARGGTPDFAPPPPPRDSHAYASSGYYPSPSPVPTYPRYADSNSYSSARTQQAHWPPPTQDEAVVLLMEDVRYASLEPDYQLAEVSVQLRPGEEGCWWADGEEVIKALQGTPSRLEGGAKVFARRGKYRHCFVRFSEEGAMECQQSSLMVSRDKTIELIIESNPEGRHILSQAQAPPPDAYTRSYASQRSSYDYPQYQQTHAQAPQNAYPSPHYFLPSQMSNGKRGGAPSDMDEHPSKRAKPSPAGPASGSSMSKRAAQSRHSAQSAMQPSTAGGAPPSGMSVGLGLSAAPAPGTSVTRASSPESLAADPTSPYGMFQRNESHPVAQKAPKEVVNAAIVAYLRSHIQTEDGYIEFAASKGRLLPIPDLLKGYRFATRIVNTWANRKTPATLEGCPNKRITKNHVLQALFRQTSWGSDCEQTLQLADKYGPNGPYEDSRVVEILNGGSMLPEKSGDKSQGRSQGSVALLDFLKDVDKEHKAKQEEEQRQSASKDSNEGGKPEGEADGD